MHQPETPAWKRKPVLWAALILIVGCVLRLSFGADIEYKADEAYNFQLGQTIGTTTPWVWVGMGSSAGIVNPGLSIWLFVFLTKLFSAHTPVALSQAVQLCNCLALAVLLGFALSLKVESERKVWLWGAAIAAVNPISIVLQRKLWAPSVLPVFSILFLMAWRKSDRKAPAFFWGLIGALLGQIHMGGFFYAAAFVIWTYFFDPEKKTRWKYWLGGSFLGALPLIPWVIATTHALSKDQSYFKWVRLVMFKFWNYWIVNAFGTNISYSIGDNFNELLRYPLIGGMPTYLGAIAQGLLCVSAVGFMIATFVYWKRKGWGWKPFFMGRDTDTGFMISAAFWGMGILITLAAVAFQNQYLLVVFPLQFVWLARGALRWGRKGEIALLAIVIAQAVISADFLLFIHDHGGAPGADYGVAYSKQGRSE
jgi:hypothetical protein